MRWYHPLGMLVIGWWQVGPLPGLDQDGHLRLSAMGGGGQFEEATFDCDGNLVGSSAFHASDLGTRLDIVGSGSPATSLALSASRSSDDRQGANASRPGTILTGRVAFDWPRAGFGVGVMVQPEGALPSVSLRVGPRSGHMLLEVAPPSETYRVTGVFRGGIGFSYGFAGIAVAPNGGQTSGQADLALPLAHRFDLLLRGYYGPGHRTPHYGGAGGFRARF